MPIDTIVVLSFQGMREYALAIGSRHYTCGCMYDGIELDLFGKGKLTGASNEFQRASNCLKREIGIVHRRANLFLGNNQFGNAFLTISFVAPQCTRFINILEAD